MSALPVGVTVIRMQPVRISLGATSVCVAVAMKEMGLSVQVCMITGCLIRMFFLFSAIKNADIYKIWHARVVDVVSVAILY